ncbi:MAG: PilZ domain-containing protein [candidate division FCPU426 bacterium]
MPDAVFNGETGAERRKFVRRPIKLKVTYRCLERDHVSTVRSDLAEDLGAGGLLLRTHQPLKADQVLMLTLFLPPQDRRQPAMEHLTCPEEECQRVEILSRVAWSAAAPSNGFLAGVQFLDLEQNHRKWLKEFLVEFQLDQPNSQLYT